MDDIDAVLAPELLTLQEPPTSKDACIEYLLDRAVEADRVADRSAALEALLAREAETAAGIGKGIGLFHAKTDAVVQPTIVFARSDEGIDIDTMDGAPATLLFLLLVPSDSTEAHLSILSSLSRALMHDDVRAGLHDAASPAEVRATLVEAVA
ncbi:PTS sugar transporter subunit IIA [Halosolutus amylolyticus]|uniref:PTS sugar transporter subunit IIA n=1 Tax=Halosolutus amylolyticus TaxID=2932267 RepID=A0ABD5PS10_9EURY|nr:PTS sugar transporter subunit IIA [Halosolutus amylolyticus]